MHNSANVLMLLNCALKMIKMVNFMSCVFSHNYENKTTYVINNHIKEVEKEERGLWARLAGQAAWSSGT